ncbi:hypothetical protein ACTQ49_07870 [Luteococcus sp. Sow4_B9]|uniref:hypothetical protein n=1 Tax=Luteococcus sp. Sow4_B9 TaxID=3438792 RepID=UPI003F96C747
MAAAPKKKSDPTIVIVLIICILVGMWQGARGLVHGASAGERSRSDVISVENARTLNGSLRVSTSMCSDTSGLDSVRYRVEDSTGREVAKQQSSYVAGRLRQTANLGTGLPAGRYRVEVACLSNGQPTGETKSTHVTVGEAKNHRPADLPRTGD